MRNAAVVARLVLLIALSTAVGCYAPVRDDQMTTVAQHVNPLIESRYIPGAVVGVYHGGRETFYSFGSLSYDSDTPPDEHTFYETGSVGKIYTALLLVEADRRGELSLNEPLSQFTLVRDAAPRLASQEVLLWHLATHLSGLPREPDNLDHTQPNPYAGYSKEQLWAALEGSPLHHTPGEEYEYSNLGVGLLGTLLEEATGLSYTEQIAQRIAAPLGLSETTTALHGAQSALLAPPYAYGAEAINWPADDALAASGCLRSTATDTLRFVRLHLDPPDTPLGRSMLRTSEQRHAFDQGGGIGLGWHILEDGTRWHNGSTGGYHTFVAFNRASDFALVLLTNDVCPEATEAGLNLADAFSGLGHKPITLPVPVELSDSAREALLGRYSDPDSQHSITVTRRGTRVFAQLTGQPAYLILPESETLFYYRVVEASLRFGLNEHGTATRVTLLQDGVEWTLHRE